MASPQLCLPALTRRYNVFQLVYRHNKVIITKATKRREEVDSAAILLPVKLPMAQPKLVSPDRFPNFGFCGLMNYVSLKLAVTLIFAMAFTGLCHVC